MRNVIFVVLFVCMSFVGRCQKAFVIVRYDLSEAPSTMFIDRLEQLQQDAEQCVIYYASASTPIVCKNVNEWEYLRQRIYTQQSTPDFYDEVDISSVNSLTSELFDEYVDTNGHVRGNMDNQWECVFFLPDKMWNDGDCRWLNIQIQSGELDMRMPVSVFVTTANGIEEKELEKVIKN